MGTINLFWSGPHKPNWGDELNKKLVKIISGKDPVWTDHRSGVPYYMGIGSILKKANPLSTVWGSGFMWETDRILNFNKDIDIRAVRGPLSRNILIGQGIKCPEVYGDPALLYPRFYTPSVKKEYKWGIVPHYIDYDNEWVQGLMDNPDINVIDILDPTINKFVEEVNKCEVILSSSLHGIICGDSYGIPSYWIKLSDDVLGGGFKFRDYFESVGRNDTDPIIIHKDTKISDIKIKDWRYSIDINLDKLYDACPFKK